MNCPIEKTYKEFRLLDGTTKLIQKAIREGEITKGSASLLSLFTYSLVMGIGYVQMMRSDEHGAPSPVWETIQLSRVDVSYEAFKKYTLKVLDYILKDGSFLNK